MEVGPKISDKLLGLESFKNLGVGQNVVLEGRIVRFVPEYDLALISIDGPVGQAGVYVHVSNLKVRS